MKNKKFILKGIEPATQYIQLLKGGRIDLEQEPPEVLKKLTEALILSGNIVPKIIVKRLEEDAKGTR